MVNATHQYRNYQVETAGPGEQIALLYDGARRFVDLAEAALQERRLDAVSLYTGKAQRIFAELAASLNFEAGDIAQNLNKLYDYWSWRLSQGLIQKDPAAYREVSAVLMDLHGAWTEAAKQARAQRGAMANEHRG